MTLAIRPLDPSTELDAYLAVLNQASSVPVTAEQWREQERRGRAGRARHHLVGERDGRVVALGSLVESFMTPGGCQAVIVVDRQERGRGHGRAMASALVALLDPAAPLVAAVRDDDAESRAWVERRGFSAFDHTFESTLDLERFDAAAVARPLDPEFTVGPYDERDGLYELVVALFADVPAADIETPTREDFEERLLGRSQAFVLVARTGDELAGVAIVLPAGDDQAWNGLTGVRREFRGRGLARALKIAAAMEARRRGMRWLRTSNNATNAPMLAVNDALGFERAAGYVWLRR